MSIINLTSLDWSDEERYGLVGHSFRVMAKAGNLDEMVVGLMHACYAGSSYTRSLYCCDVEGDPEWKTALDLFVPPLKLKKRRKMDDVSEEYLLDVNMPQGFTEIGRKYWMLDETVWSTTYADYIWNIRRNRIARNVMIHKLEDMIDVLKNPGKYETESGKQYYVLPWKKHYVVELPLGTCRREERIPETDDAVLLRDPSDEERLNLIDKYERAINLLQECYPIGDNFTEEERLKNEERCHRWFLSWMDKDKYLNESEDIPF